MAIKLFGYTFFDDEDTENAKSIAADPNDGSTVVTTGDNSGDLWGSVGDASGYSMTFDVDPTVVSEQQLITKYREISLIPEVEKAIDIIINEMIATGSNDLVSLDLDDLEYSDELKEKIMDEFDHVVELLDFNQTGFETLKRWYIDGRMQYHVVVDKDNYKEEGINKLTYVDPRKLKKVRVVKAEKDVRTAAMLYSDVDEFYAFSESGFVNEIAPNLQSEANGETVKLTKESIVQVTSGLLNPNNTVVLSWLHKAIRPLNQLKSLEDASIIYRLARAPERRVFYIDVGNLPPAKAEQVLKRQMHQYKSKMVYDTASGTVRADPKQMTMIEDYWLPRRSDGKATEITTLPGGQNLGEMNEVNYFLNKLYNALNVPITRMDPNTGFSVGKTTEITRDEVMLIKFVNRIRRRFSNLFLDLLKRQLALKNILNDQEFDRVRQFITVEYDSDNHFDELLANEVMDARLTAVDRQWPYKGMLFSVEYIMRQTLKFSQEDIDQMMKQMKQEQAAGLYDDPNAEDVEGTTGKSGDTSSKPVAPQSTIKDKLLGPSQIDSVKTNFNTDAPSAPAA